MTAESVTEMARELLRGERFIDSHRQIHGEDGIFDEKEVPVLEAVANVPSFSSFNQDKKRTAFRLGLIVASNVSSEMMVGNCNLNTAQLKQELAVALEAGSQLGQEDAQLVLDMAFNAALSAWGVK
jgi:hypothetical protein